MNPTPKLLPVLLSVPLICLSVSALAVQPDPLMLLKYEKIGGIYLDFPATRLPVQPKCPVKLGANQLWAADGLYHQDWDYPACGLTYNMSSNSANGIKQVFSITIKAPSRLATKRGIRIGSSEKDARKAYAQEFNASESTPGQMLVFGSIYGGLMMTIQRGRVSEIFLGSAAE